MGTPATARERAFVERYARPALEERALAALVTLREELLAPFEALADAYPADECESFAREPGDDEPCLCIACQLARVLVDARPR